MTEEKKMHEFVFQFPDGTEEVIEVDPIVVAELTTIAIKENKTLEEVVVEAIQEELEKYE